MRDQINEAINRRNFFGRAARGAGWVVAGTAAATLVAQKAPAAEAQNPFALDIDRLTRTDPKLIKYEEVSRFPVEADPRRISLGLDGNLYVASANEVTVLDLSGNLVRRVSIASPAGCVCADPDGTIYVGFRDHVEVFDSTGQRRQSWESAGQRAWFSGLAAGRNEIYAADSGNRIVHRYDKSGKRLGTIGAKDKARSVRGLIIPSPYLDVKIGNDGLLRVNNFGRHCVETYTPEGDLELFWGKPSAGITGFCGCCNPVSVALLPDSSYVTCEKGLPRVKIYSATGEFISVVAGVESFPENAKSGAPSKGLDCRLGGLDAAVDGQGHIYVLDLVANHVRKYKAKA